MAAPRPLKAESHTSNFSNLGSVVRRRPQSPSAHSSIPHLSAVHHVVFVPCPVNSSPQHHHLRIPIFPNELVDFCKPFQKIIPFHEPPWPEIQTHQLLSGRRSWPTSPSSTESPTSPCAEQIAVLFRVWQIKRYIYITNKYVKHQEESERFSIRSERMAQMPQDLDKSPRPKRQVISSKMAALKH